MAAPGTLYLDTASGAEYARTAAGTWVPLAGPGAQYREDYAAPNLVVTGHVRWVLFGEVRFEAKPYPRQIELTSSWWADFPDQAPASADIEIRVKTGAAAETKLATVFRAPARPLRTPKGCGADVATQVEAPAGVPVVVQSFAALHAGDKTKATIRTTRQLTYLHAVAYPKR
ncbi:hypothetical protein [Streptomyces olivoreticuli]|uniref:hypothetical protein n=1 Tax=Streptomyces olivoreticuli TaxID=68246 RepID=UPI000E246E80|nr:hypothetical protein [Streptomyces olivoreticuli]